MFYQGQMMNQGSCGCNSGCPQGVPTNQQCNQVVQTCNVQDVPHYINYHTHVVVNLTASFVKNYLLYINNVSL